MDISAIPAGILQAPTPIFLIRVGYSSAVKIGMTALVELIPNFAIITIGSKRL